MFIPKNLTKRLIKNPRNIIITNRTQPYLNKPGFFQKIQELQRENKLGLRKEKYSDETRISQILKEYYIGEEQKYIEVDVQFLEKNRVFTLKNWKKLSSESKKKYPDGLRSLLDGFLVKNLEDFIDIKSLHKVQPKVSDRPFVEREQELKITEEVARLNYSSFLETKEQDTEKQKHIFTIVNGGSGSGKTRTCHEFAQHLKQCTHINDCFQNTLMIFIDFSNGSQLLPEEKDVNQILGLRLFVRALTESGKIEELEKKGFDLKYFLEKKAFKVENVLNLIASTYHKLLNSDDPIPLVIACDEFQFMINEFPKDYKQIYRVLGSYMTAYNDSHSRNIFSQNNLVIFPIIAGTITQAEVIFELTEYQNRSISLSPLSWNGIQKVLEYYEIHPTFFDTNEKIRFWTLTGMIPRALYRSIEIIKESKLDTFTLLDIDSLFRKIEKFLTIFYKVNEIGVDGPEFLFYSISGCKVNVKSKWFREKSHKGIIYSQNSRLYLPFPYFTNLVIGKFDITSDLIPPLISFFTWSNFESLTLRVIFSNLYGRKNLDLETLGFENRTVSIQELFPGAHINPSIMDIKLNLNHDVDFSNKIVSSPMLKGTRDIPQFQSFEFNHNKTMVIQEPKLSMLVDGIISHPSTDKNILFLIQFKFKEKAKLDGEDQLKTSPQKWISQMKNVEQLKELKDFKLIFVYITNANIPKKTNEIMETDVPIVIIDQRSFEEFFTPNLYPYVKYIHDEKKPESIK
jgi:hypothetical protein